MQVFTCLSHRNRIPFDATSSLLDQNEGQGPFSGALAPPLGASPSSISTHQRLSAVAPAYIYPICSMYGIFTYIWVFFGQMLVNIPDMENMGICINTIKIVHIIYHIEKHIVRDIFHII